MSAMPTAFHATPGRPFSRNKFRGYHINHSYGIWIFTGSVILAVISPGINSRVTISAMPTAFRQHLEDLFPEINFGVTIPAMPMAFGFLREAFCWLDFLRE